MNTIEQSNLPFIIAAYAVSWTVILGYLLRVVRKTSRARSEYDRIARDPAGGTR